MNSFATNAAAYPIGQTGPNSSQNVWNCCCSSHGFIADIFDPSNIPESSVSEKRIETIQELGRGAFGKVYLVCCRTTERGFRAALKVQKLDQRALVEVAAMWRLRGVPFTTQLLDVWTVKNNVCQMPPQLHMLLRFCAAGHLEDVYRDPRNRYVSTLETLRLVTAHIATGLDFIHSNGVVHGDLNLTNILVDEMGNCVISDFGQALLYPINFCPNSRQRASAPQLLNSPAFPPAVVQDMVPPEYYAQFGPGYGMDFFQFGVTLWALLTDTYPGFNAKPYDHESWRYFKPSLPEQLDTTVYHSTGFVDFLYKLIEGRQSQRLGIAQPCWLHPFLQKFAGAASLPGAFRLSSFEF